MLSVLRPGAFSYSDGRACRPIAIWLTACCVLVACMVLLGGYTRLSGSGLSMPSWQPLGMMPPLFDADWQQHYRAYKATPEYRAMLHDFDSFKTIFWIEYSHRVLGRFLAFFSSLLCFLLGGVISIGHG